MGAAGAPTAASGASCFDLRIQLVHDHDEQLTAALLALTPEERPASLEDALELLSQARIVDDDSR